MITTPTDVAMRVRTDEPAAGEVLLDDDAIARTTALAPDRSFIVQAPAGSGKTELLTQRVLKLLAIVDHPEEIVALTFTRKAAREMRERIIGALNLALQPEAPAEPHKRLTWQLAEAALRRDAEREWCLLEYPGRLRVMTIDSLCSSLARQMPVVSRFGAVPEVGDDPDALYRDAARALLKALDSNEAYVPSLEQLLLHLDNEHPRVEALIIKMLSRRDQWLRHVVRVGMSGDDIRDELERGLQDAVVATLARARGLMSDVLCSEIVELARAAGVNMHSDGTESPLCECRTLSELRGDSHEELAAWNGIADLLLTKAGSWRSESRLVGFPTKDPDRPRMKQLILDLRAGEYKELEDALCAIRELPDPHYTEEQWQTMLALVEVLKASAAFLQTSFQMSGQVDFAGISMAARDALGTDGNPTDLALSLDYQIRHLLVDEFQDTSHGQFELLAKLTAGWMPGDGRTMFAVGDPMQSIYRFREAEVGLFMQAQESGIGSVVLENLTLSANFRSQRGIVSWVNEAFATIFPPERDKGSGAVPYTASAARRDTLDGDAAVCIPQINGDYVEEARSVAEIIRRERAADPAASIAILVRARTHLESIVERLNADGVPFEAVEIDRLRDRPVVSDLLSLTRAILHPADRIAWLAVLRAPWCGLTLADLVTITEGGADRTLWTLLCERERIERLDDNARQRVELVSSVMSDVVRERRRRTLRRTVEGAWNALGGPACATRANELRDAGRFFELLDQHEEGGDIIDVSLLEADAEKLYASPDMSDGAVQIMTVHKAKGLEFDVVILPGLGRSTRPPESELLLFKEQPHGQSVNLLIAPIKSSAEAEPDRVYDFLKSLERTKSQHEDRRVMYVAATRARNRLYLLGRCRSSKTPGISPPKGSPLHYMWPMIGPRYVELYDRMSEEGVLDGDGVQVAARAPRPITRLSSAWKSPGPPPDVRWDRAGREVESRQEDVDVLRRTWAEATTRHIGTAVHRMLCRIAREGLDTWTAERVESRRDAIRAMLSGLGIGDAELDGAVRDVVEAINSTLADERGRWILSSSHTSIDNELPLSGVIDGDIRSIKIDRTFIDADGTRWIIDYKAGVHEGVKDRDTYFDMEMSRYRHQLELYATLLGAIDPERPVRKALYFPRLGGWREW